MVNRVVNFLRFFILFFIYGFTYLLVKDRLFLNDETTLEKTLYTLSTYSFLIFLRYLLFRVQKVYNIE
jgi:hypothetical protein